VVSSGGYITSNLSSYYLHVYLLYCSTTIVAVASVVARSSESEIRETQHDESC
jgi:hypothetical protein